MWHKGKKRRRSFRINAAGNMVVRIIGKPPLELLSSAACPFCGESYYNCDHINHLTLDQLAEKGYARYVEQI